MYKAKNRKRDLRYNNRKLSSAHRRRVKRAIEKTVRQAAKKELRK